MVGETPKMHPVVVFIAGERQKISELGGKPLKLRLDRLPSGEIMRAVLRLHVDAAERLRQLFHEQGIASTLFDLGRELDRDHPNDPDLVEIHIVGAHVVPSVTPGAFQGHLGYYARHEKNIELLEALAKYEAENK